MANIEVTTKYDALVVDSRLIADKLGVEHHTFIKTLNKYLDRIESRFGVVRFEVDKPSEGSAGGRPEKFAYLTEAQATTLMTFSRNTDQVIECKLRLIEAFESAKQIIKEVIPAQSDRIRELELELALSKQQERTAVAEIEAADAKEKYVAKCEAIKDLHGEQMLALLQGNPDAVIEKVTTITETIVIKEGKQRTSYNGISTAQLGKQLGFRTGKDFELFLKKIKVDNLIEKGERTVDALYIRPENIGEIKRAVAKRRLDTTRQLIIGE